MGSQPPYPPQTAGVGGAPTIAVDVAICVVLLVLYICSAAANMFIYQRNRRLDHFFLPSALLFGFSMARILTFTLRIVWSVDKQNVSLAIAANIFVNAGVLIVYIINLLFAQRILRALQPKVGWHRGLKISFIMLYTIIGCSLALIIVLTVESSYTLDPAIHSYAMWIQRGAILYLLLVVLIPFFIVALAFALPQPETTETFGHGSIRSKAIILLASTCLCTLIAGFKVGTTWSAPRPASNPAWFHSKPAFYCLLFVPELLILVLYTSTRMDLRFHVPNGSSKRQSYAVQERRGSENDIEEADSELEKRKDSELASATA